MRAILATALPTLIALLPGYACGSHRGVGSSGSGGDSETASGGSGGAGGTTATGGTLSAGGAAATGGNTAANTNFPVGSGGTASDSCSAGYSGNPFCGGNTGSAGTSNSGGTMPGSGGMATGGRVSTGGTVVGSGGAATGGGPGTGGGGAGSSGSSGVDAGTACSCAGGKTTLECFCKFYACTDTLSSYTPDAGAGLAYTTLEEYADCNLVVVTIINSIAPQLYVFDRTTGRLVGRRFNSDINENCPFGGGSAGYTLTAGQYPDSTCVRTKCVNAIPGIGTCP